MNNTEFFPAAEECVSRELGVEIVDRSGCGSRLLYNDTYIEVKPSYTDEQEPSYFDIRRSASSVCVFSVNDGCQWDFYIVKSSVIDSCFENLSVISLPLIEPIALHVRLGGIKQAIDLAVGIA